MACALPSIAGMSWLPVSSTTGTRKPERPCSICVWTSAIRCGTLEPSERTANILTRTRTEQVSLRLPRDTKRVLQQRASIAGQSLTDFMVTCSIERARELLKQLRTVTMNQSAFDAFAAALDGSELRPATPLAVKVIEDYAGSIKEDGSFDW